MLRRSCEQSNSHPSFCHRRAWVAVINASVAVECIHIKRDKFSAFWHPHLWHCYWFPHAAPERRPRPAVWLFGTQGCEIRSGEEGRGRGRNGGMKEGWRSHSILADGFHCPPHCSASFQTVPLESPTAVHILSFYCRYGTHVWSGLDVISDGSWGMQKSCPRGVCVLKWVWVVPKQKCIPKVFDRGAECVAEHCRI